MTIISFERGGFLIEADVDPYGIDDELDSRGNALAEQGIAMKHDGYDWVFGIEDLPGKLLDNDDKLDRMWLDLDVLGSDMEGALNLFRRETTADNAKKLNDEIGRLAVQLGTLSAVAESSPRIVARRFGPVRVWVDLDIWQKHAEKRHKSALAFAAMFGGETDPNPPAFSWEPVEWEAEEIAEIVDGALYFAWVRPLVDGQPDREKSELFPGICAGVPEEKLTAELVWEELQQYM